MERQIFIDSINKQIVEAETPEQRQVIAHIASKILIDAEDQYRGYSYVYWLEKGWEEWMKAGQPEDETKKKFFGDTTKVKFF